ncbi:MAG: patatin-like phospholipase family protein [Methyloprofundus sp.]|nr:patatin-like phospholipase family protein [Methyloprofundus sp.]
MLGDLKVGLTLSGGGAKGAYQVGVIKGLAKLGMQVDAISGASIGSLNGGVVASASNLNEAYVHLDKLWTELSNLQVIQANPSSFLLFLQKSGLKFNGALIRKAMANIGLEPSHFIEERGVLKEDPLRLMLDKFLDQEALNSGTPLYVSVYESEGFLHDIVSAIPSLLHLSNGKDSEFFHIQSLPVDEQKEALLASAAIPFLFEPKKIGGKIYSDGGLGGWKNSQGNTPVTPLINNGCDVIIVSHLEDGSLWDRNQFPNTTFIEVRPQANISRNTGLLGGAKDILGFEPSNVQSWINQGYQDTLHCVGRVYKALSSRKKLSDSKTVLLDSFKKNMDADEHLADAMALIKLDS